MKRRMATTMMAATLCTAMLGSTALAADPNKELGEAEMGGSTITGDSEVENPTYKIVVPTTLEFAIDPFQQKGQSQIYSKDFYMVNKSNVPVQLDCAVTLAAGSGVELKNSAEEVTETNSDKLIYMEAEIPGTVAETTASAPAAFKTALKTDGTDYWEASVAPSTATTAAEEMLDTTDAKGTYTTSKKVGLGTAEKTLSFALKEADYQEYFTAEDKSASAKQFKQVATSQAGSTAFRFSGKVNTKATWAAKAVTATVKYTFNGLTPTNYADLTKTPVAGAHAYVEGSKDPALVSVGAFTKASPANVVINFDLGVGSGAVDADGVTLAYGSSKTVVNTAKYTVDMSNKTVTIDKSAGFMVNAAADIPVYVTLTKGGSAVKELSGTITIK